MEIEVLENRFEDLMQDKNLNPTVFRQLGDEFVDIIRSSMGVDTVTYSEEYVFVIDKMVTALREKLLADELLFTMNLLSFGSFLGETLIGSFDGAWAYNQEKNRWGVVLKTEDAEEIFLNVFYKVKNRIIKGEEDSIDYYYQSNKKMLAEGVDSFLK